MNYIDELQSLILNQDNPERDRLLNLTRAIADELSRAKEHCKECEQSHVAAEESRDNLTAQIDKIHHAILSSEATLPATYSIAAKVQALVDEHRSLKVEAMNQSSRLVGAYKLDVTAWRRSLAMLLESLLDADLQDKDAIAKALLRQVEKGI